jgi:hypothetical protein
MWYYINMEREEAQTGKERDVESERVYKWKQVWAVRTQAEDSVAPGDVITVHRADGSGTKQRVLSVTTERGMKGQEYKTLIVEGV